MAIVLYMTTKAIENPIGDGRHNRAAWRSPLDQTRVPAGFVFALDDEGNIEDRSKPVYQVASKRGKPLRERLMEVASAPLSSPTVVEEETVEDVLREAGGERAIPEVLKALSVTPSQLRALLAGEPPKPKAKPEAVARASR
jgi:hypothetical protein